MTFNVSSNLVGIGSHVERVETLLCLESSRFRMVGLWGMGGIGKTTIARATFNHLYTRFDAFYFVESVSNELKNLSVDGLREKMVLKLLEKESISMESHTVHRDFIINQFQRKKVLIVLDDVDDAIEAKDLLNDFFSGGSRILVTSRDKQVLKVVVDDENLIYEVEALNEEEGLQLFSLGAFKQNLFELSMRVLSYTRGNPLALVVLGHAHKSKEEWLTALDELEEEPFPDMLKVLRISYDAVCDEEKMIFLDIACFLAGKKLDFVVAYYEGYVKRIGSKISNLVNKSLIIISQEKELKMHDLFFKCFYACDHQRSSMIEAISVDLSQVDEISEFDCSVLSRLDSLRFLELHHPDGKESKVTFRCEGFEGFPDEVRYLRWDSYPLKSLPSTLSSFA